MNWSNMHFQMLCLRNSINLKHFYILHILGSPFIGFALHLTAHHWPRKNESSKRQIQNTEAQSVRIDCRDFSRFRMFFAITCIKWIGYCVAYTYVLLQARRARAAIDAHWLQKLKFKKIYLPPILIFKMRCASGSLLLSLLFVGFFRQILAKNMTGLLKVANYFVNR